MSCSSENPEGNNCGWALKRNYPCIAADYYGLMRAVAAAAGLAGIVCFNKYFSRAPFRRIFASTQLIVFAATCLDVVWVARWNLALGIDDHLFMLGADVVQPVVQQLAGMPMLVLAAKVCPVRLEGTLFALLMGLSNFGTVLGGYHGAALLRLFGGVVEPEFRHIEAFVAVRTLFYLAPIGLIPLLVPNLSPDDAPDDAPGAPKGKQKASLELVCREATEETGAFV
mmetsp:Transcript_25981/g.89641  ORF Transcript_25981/g.89641 Transcript_25981/m.89641 type:complete len:226 (-) Transcript_25981:32-709(-)